ELCEQQHKRARTALVAALEDPLLPLAWLGPLWSRYKEQWQQDQQSKHAHLLIEEFGKRDQRILELLARQAPQARSAVAELLAADLQGLQSARRHPSVLLPGGDPVEIQLRLQQAKQHLKEAQAAVAATQQAMEKAQHAVDQIPAHEQLGAVFEAMQQHTQAVSTSEWRVQELTRELEEARSKQLHFNTRYKAALSRA
ncbi:hypothetical protein, partial [Pseudomonas aeruginosa]